MGARRGLAIFLTVYFGALTLGSAVWGEVATLKGVPFALACAGVGALIGLAVTWGWKLQTSEAQDLTPSMRWRAPSFANRVPDDSGPILGVIEYLIDPSESAAFLAVMEDVSLERKRDGAYAWHMFEDPNQEGKIVETFLVHSLLELRYREARVTKADAIIEDRARQFLKAPAESRFLVAPQRRRREPGGGVDRAARPWSRTIRGRQISSSRRWGYFRMSTVTRLFSWRPSGLSEPSGLLFGATGSRAPKPDVARFAAANCSRLASHVLTDAARRSDRRKL